MGQLFLIAWRNLIQHTRRTAMLGAAIAAVCAVLVLLLGVTNGIESQLLRSSTTLGSGHINVGGFFKITAGSSAPVVTKYQELIETIKKETPELDYVVSRGRGYGKLVSENGNSMQAGINGITIENEKGIQQVVRLLEGSFNDLKEPGTILLFASQAKKLEVKVGDALTLAGMTMRGATNTTDLRVVAIAEDMGLMSMWNTFVPESSVRQLYSINDNTTGALLLYLKNIDDAPAVTERLRKRLAELGYPMMNADPRPFFMKFEVVNREDWTGQKLDLTSWEEEIQMFTWMIKGLKFLFVALTVILLIVISIGIMNAMWIAIRERTREIGTLRAIGMQRRRVLAMFVIEAFVLAITSTVAGAILGLLLSVGLNAAQWKIPWPAVQIILMSDRLYLEPQFLTVLGSIFLITFCTTLIALIPSFLAARMRPVTAMHFTG
jgi:putative ABC transport system permease protein